MRHSLGLSTTHFALRKPMKPVFEKVPLREGESFHCEVICGPDYGTRWHFHPEFQLTLAIRSAGHRIVGDNIGTLSDGDLVLLGSNLPHVWHQDCEAGSVSRQTSQERGRTKQCARGSEGNLATSATDSAVHAIVIRFERDFLGDGFLAKPEAAPLARLLQRASRGLRVNGRTRNEVARRVESLAESDGLGRLVELLAILHTLSISKDLTPLASAGYAPALRAEDQGRMERVCDFIDAHLTEEIARSHLAKIAALSESAFSRFFKSRTGRSVPQYVNELRISRACRMLAEDRLNITDIALDCGFPNLSNFNRRFREIMKTTPREYRRAFTGTASL